MSQNKLILLGGVIVTTGALLFAALYAGQSRLRRESKEGNAKVVRSLGRVERAYKAEKLRSAALQQSLRRGQEEIVILLRRLVESSQALQEGFQREANSTEQVALEVEQIEGDGDDDEGELPPLPEDMPAAGFMQSLKMENLESIFDDRRLNPEGKELTRVEAAELVAVVTEAKGTMETLDRQVAAIALKGMEDLRARDDYIDHARGERYHTEEGVYTAGEGLEDGGMRMFYLYPDEFPEIYEKRDKKTAVAEKAVRKLLSIFATEPAD